MSSSNVLTSPAYVQESSRNRSVYTESKFTPNSRKMNILIRLPYDILFESIEDKVILINAIHSAIFTCFQRLGTHLSPRILLNHINCQNDVFFGSQIVSLYESSNKYILKIDLESKIESISTKFCKLSFYRRDNYETTTSHNGLMTI